MTWISSPMGPDEFVTTIVAVVPVGTLANQSLRANVPAPDEATTSVALIPPTVTPVATELYVATSTARVALAVPMATPVKVELPPLATALNPLAVQTTEGGEVFHRANNPIQVRV